MLITFKSKAAADIVMYKEHAQRILELLSKSVERGIIVHADLQKSIATIEAAITESKAHSVTQHVSHDITIHPQGNHDHEPIEGVSFSSRAYPLLQMLRAADKLGYDVVWGV